MFMVNGTRRSRFVPRAGLVPRDCWMQLWASAAAFLRNALCAPCCTASWTQALLRLPPCLGSTYGSSRGSCAATLRFQVGRCSACRSTLECLNKERSCNGPHIDQGVSPNDTHNQGSAPRPPVAVQHNMASQEIPSYHKFVCKDATSVATKKSQRSCPMPQGSTLLLGAPSATTQLRCHKVKQSTYPYSLQQMVQDLKTCFCGATLDNIPAKGRATCMRPSNKSCTALAAVKLGVTFLLTSVQASKPRSGLSQISSYQHSRAGSDNCARRHWEQQPVELHCVVNHPRTTRRVQQERNQNQHPRDQKRNAIIIFWGMHDPRPGSHHNQIDVADDIQRSCYNRAPPCLHAHRWW
jgi:hypothetical protein